MLSSDAALAMLDMANDSEPSQETSLAHYGMHTSWSHLWVCLDIEQLLTVNDRSKACEGARNWRTKSGRDDLITQILSYQSIGLRENSTSCRDERFDWWHQRCKEFSVLAWLNVPRNMV